MRYVRYTYPVARTAYTAGRNIWDGLDQEVNRLFQTVATSLASEHAFPVDVYTDKDNVFVRAELPGVDREALSVEITDDQLTISAARKTAGENEPADNFSRTLTVPEAVQSDKVTAAYIDGILTVTLPKVEAVKPRKVSVNVN
ncbi:MAG TPA: Hsp20/alpha crystallin family protein [Opitutaceae bacterium]